MRSLQAALWAVFCCLLSGCSVMGHVAPPFDWPELRVNVYRSGFFMVQCRCGNSLWLLQQVIGCAVPGFKEERCDIWVVALDPELEEPIIKHERLHCRGMDHPGSTRLADYWADYKVNGREERWDVGNVSVCEAKQMIGETN